MGIKETLFLDRLQSVFDIYGQKLPKCLETAASELGIQLSESDFPQVHIDFDQKYPPPGPLATSVIENHKEGKTLFINPDTLVACAQDIMDSFSFQANNPAEQTKLEEYCLIQAMVFIELQASSNNLSIEEIEKIQDEYTNIFI